VEKSDHKMVVHIVCACENVAGVCAVISLNGRYPQVTLTEGNMASCSSSHTTVVVPNCFDQSPNTSIAHHTSTMLFALVADS